MAGNRHWITITYYLKQPADVPACIQLLWLGTVTMAFGFFRHVFCSRVPLLAIISTDLLAVARLSEVRSRSGPQLFFRTWTWTPRSGPPWAGPGPGPQRTRARGSRTPGQVWSRSGPGPHVKMYYIVLYTYGTQIRKNPCHGPTLARVGCCGPALASVSLPGPALAKRNVLN